MVSFASCHNRGYEDFNLFRKKPRLWFWLRIASFCQTKQTKKSHLSFWSRSRSHDTNLFPQVDDISSQSSCKSAKGINETSHTNRARSVLSSSGCYDCIVWSKIHEILHCNASVVFTILATSFSGLRQELYK